MENHLNEISESKPVNDSDVNYGNWDPSSITKNDENWESDATNNTTYYDNSTNDWTESSKTNGAYYQNGTSNNVVNGHINAKLVNKSWGETPANEQEYQCNNNSEYEDYSNKNDESQADIFAKNNQNNKNMKGYYDFNSEYTNSGYNAKNHNRGNENAGYQGSGRGRGSGKFMGKISNGHSANNEIKSGKPPISKPTYIPPEFDEDNDITIEAGSNFEKYDKIEVTVSGIELPKNIPSFHKSGLREVLLSNLKKCHYSTPTPIQKYALPIIMDGRDMIASAQTGSGKTAAFILPILNSLLSDPTELIVDTEHCEPQAVIMSPTRELAIQICETATRLSKLTIIKSELLYGGTATYYQKRRILNGAHIIVATPGRLNDFVDRGLITFSSLRFFVLDEADRMLDMGFKLDIEHILNHSTMVPSAERTTLMFSATLPEEVQQIAKCYLKPDYVLIAVGENGGACKDVTQTIMEVKKFDKKKMLMNILNETDDCQGTIVFVEQKRNADFIAVYLNELNFPTTSIHGDREQPEREKALKDFKTKKMKVLVATAVAARGLDISGVTTVINFDLPKHIEEYVHRIGRTGRLGNAGRAISFYDPKFDWELAPHLVNTLKQADQEIPDFLSQFSNGAFASNNQFNDIRADVTVTSEYVPREEEEQW